MADTPIARSPIAQAPPVTTVAGWEVSARRCSSPMRLVDCTPCVKILTRAAATSSWAQALGVELGRARRGDSGWLVAGVAPAQWLFIGAPGALAPTLAAGDGDGAMPLLTATELTHANVMVRLVGADSAKLLSKLCGIDLRDAVTPNLSALRTSIARVAVELIRDDRIGADGASPNEPLRSYLILCDRSAGQYLFDALLDAGQEFGIEVEGFAAGGF